MAYRRSRSQPMCRHCYTYGHTKRSCPKVKEIVAQNPNSYLADSLKRKCSYCRAVGHTRAKCPEYEEKKRKWRVEMLENRTTVCAALIEQGIAPGALVKAEFYIPSDNPNRARGWYKLPAIVSKVNWDIITKTYSDMLEVVSPEYNIITHCRAPKHPLLRDNYSDVVILSPMSTEMAKRYNENEMQKYDEKVLKENAK